MTFEEILDQAVDMLQRRGRLTYRMLKRQFDLDDDTLEDLKEAIFYSHPQAIDDRGYGLIWSGESETPSTSTSIPSISHPTTPEDRSTQTPSASAQPHTPDAERRQLTVMFCDLVASTQLSSQLDPEDYRDVLRDYQTACTQVIQRFDGHIAQLLGDGLLVYFGYPQAHEDDAQRAIRTGLDMLEAMETLNTRLERDKGLRLAIRVGIHTGLVVVGEMGSGNRQEQLALGETPNIAARLEGLAVPNTVVISSRTRRLVGGAFDIEDLGVHVVKGIAEPIQIYGVDGESVVESRFEAATTTGLTPLFGREAELERLRRGWEQAKGGQGQVLLLAGEPGIGKSRLVDTLRARVMTAPHIALRYQCSPYYTNSAYYPIVAQLERAAQFARDESPEQKLTKLEALLAQGTEQVTDVAPLFAALLALPTGDRYPPLTLSPQRQKAKTIEALVEQLVGLTRQQPVLFIWEDAHWSDPTSLEVLDQMMHVIPSARVLVMITYRPEFALRWTALPHVTALTLTRLNHREVADMVARLTQDQQLSQVVLEQIVAKTDGVPLFVEELTKTVLESDLLHETQWQHELTGQALSDAIPATLQDSLMARLDRLGPVKAVAQIGAVLGREFSYQLLEAVAAMPTEALQAALGRLGEAGLVLCRGQLPEATYTFKHVLVQETAYDSLLRSRRHQLHATIAAAIEERFPERVVAEPEVIAHHYTEAGDNERAVSYWQQAGQRAMERSANAEAIVHLSKGLVLLATLPDTPTRAKEELRLQTTLGPALLMTKGWGSPEAGQAYSRARTLCQQIGDIPDLFQILWGIWMFYTAGGALTQAREIEDDLLHLAEHQGDPDLLLQAYHAAWGSKTWLGEFADARGSVDRGLAIYRPEQHHRHAMRYGGHDPGVCGLAQGGIALWFLGYADRALTDSQRALRLAEQVHHPPSLAHALNWAAMLHQFRREPEAVRAHTDVLLSLAAEQGLGMFLVMGGLLHGWALAVTGNPQEGLVQLQEGFHRLQAIGTKALHGYFKYLIAQAYAQAGRYTEGIEELDAGLEYTAKIGDRFWEAEIYRLKGEFLREQAGTAHPRQGVEEYMIRAITIARNQGAKSLELRAAMSLSRLWQQQGKCDAARELLVPIYSWFTEGFDTADLQEAKGILEELRG